MAHEHIGDCCGHLEQQHHVPEQIVAGNMGRLCCSGHCQHAEHQMQYALLSQEYSDMLALQDTLDPFESNTKKKKKKKSERTFGRLLLETPHLRAELNTN